MSWYKKEYATHFDQHPPEGMFFLDGRIIEKLTGRYVWGMKAPMLIFPSGEAYPLWDEHNPLVVVMSCVDVPLFSTRDEAYGYVERLAYLGLNALTQIEKLADDQLYLFSEPNDEGCLVVYNNTDRKLVNVLTAAFQVHDLPPVLP